MSRSLCCTCVKNVFPSCLDFTKSTIATKNVEFSHSFLAGYTVLLRYGSAGVRESNTFVFASGTAHILKFGETAAPLEPRIDWTAYTIDRRCCRTLEL